MSGKTVKNEDPFASLIWRVNQDCWLLSSIVRCQCSGLR